MTRPSPPLSTRLHSFLLGLHCPQPIPTDPSALEAITLFPAARAAFRSILDARGSLRGGVLFGRLHHDTLEVHHVAPQGYRWWPELPSPLDLDARYALGWADALVAASGVPLDWVGMWLAYPDSQVGQLGRDTPWLQEARDRGLLHDESVLLSVGWREGRLEAAGYHLVGSDVELVPVIPRALRGEDTSP